MKTRNEDNVNQRLIDDAVKNLIEMKLNQRKKEGDTKFFVAGSEHWLKFKIWKVEQEWNEKQADEAKTASRLDTADHSNNQEEAVQKTTKLNKGEESSMGTAMGWRPLTTP